MLIQLARSRLYFPPVSNWICRLEIHLQTEGETGTLFGMVQLSSVNDGRDCSRYVISNYVDSVGWKQALLSACQVTGYMQARDTFAGRW
jgi:hypothetical protein